MTHKDRLVAGGLAGAIAGLIQYVYGVIGKSLGLTDRIFGEFSSIVVSLNDYPGTLGSILEIVSHLAVSIMFGVTYVYMIKITSSRYHIIKGLGYGLILWFLLSGFGTIYRLPKFENIPPGPSLFTLVGALLYGLVLTYTLKLLDKKTKLL